MKNLKSFLRVSSCFLLLASCQKEDVNEQSIEPITNAVDKHCSSTILQEKALKNNPGLQSFLDQEEKKMEAFSKSSAAKVNKVYQVPVVVNVLFNKSVENIPDWLIRRQINILNSGFNKNENNNTGIPAEFARLDANVGVNFTLQAIHRRYVDENFKVYSNYNRWRNGGLAPVSPGKVLNVYVLPEALYGYYGQAYLPYTAPSVWDDNVLIASQAFSAWGSNNNDNNVKGGKTLIHEVGHFLNLEHIFKGFACNNGDKVWDTPNQSENNDGVWATHPRKDPKCGNNQMFMNYMDYTPDQRLVMFTKAQKERMVYALEHGRKAWTR
ncbi:M43 family zinc metalloprotease [Aquimarina latercula]|uniref:M43 family zinc metalloprotease n=1 Tax=Aquimarina latercula TaxID=987 RepID=UPI00040309FA|nr:M43 family zinc metalloprotease [Aquimarina latercula]